MKHKSIIDDLEQNIRIVQQKALNSYLYDSPQYKNSEYFVALCYTHAILEVLELNGYRITKEKSDV